MKDSHLASILFRITRFTQKMAKISFFHVLRENSGKADSLENNAIGLPQGI
jgi:hypothetical protein